MPFTSGTYTLPTGNPVVSGTTISSTTTNTTNSDIATALSACLLKNGTQTVTANIPMGGFKVTGLAAPTTAGDSLAYGSPINTTSISGLTTALSVAQGGTGVTTSTGTGSTVLSASPTLVTPVIGAATGTSLVVTAAVTGANLTYTDTLTGGTGVVAIGTNQIYKDASGNVGLGNTPSGTYKLEVTGAIGASGINTPNTFAYKNLLIDAGFTINQRAYVSAATLATTVYGHDRWKAGVSGGDYSFTQLASNTQITIASGKSLIQVVEDKNVNGTSFVLSWTGTAQARYAVNSATPAGSYAASPIVITGQTAGTTMSVEFNTGTLSKPQLELGAVATSFDQRVYSQELAMCQRYYEVWSNIGGNTGYMNMGSGGMSTTTTATFFYNFLVQKRANPSFTYSALSDFAVLYNGGAAPSTISTFTLFGSTPTTIEFQATTNTSIVAYQYIQFAANNNATTSKVSFSAEL